MKNTEFAIFAGWLLWAAGLTGAAVGLYRNAAPLPQPPPQPPPTLRFAVEQPKLDVTASGDSDFVETELLLDAASKDEVQADCEVEHKGWLQVKGAVTVTIPAGETTGRLRLPLRRPLAEGTHEAKVRLVRLRNAKPGDRVEQRLTVVVRPRASLEVVKARYKMPAREVEVKVKLDGKAPADLTVALKVTGDKDVFPGEEQRTVSIAKGESEQTLALPVKAWGASPIEQKVTVALVATASAPYLLGPASSAEITVEAMSAPPRPRVSLAARKSYKMPVAAVEVTVKLQDEAPADLTVALKVTGDKAVFPGGEERKVPIAKGEREAKLSLKVKPWGESPSTQKVTVALVKSDKITLGDPDSVDITLESVPLPSLTVTLQADKTKLPDAKGQSTTVTATLSRKADKDMVLDWDLAGTAKAGVDYEKATLRTPVKKGEDKATLELKLLERNDLPPPRAIEVGCTPAGGKPASPVKIAIAPNDDGRDVLVLVLATEDLKDELAKNKELGEDLAKVVTDHRKSLVGGLFLVTRQKGKARIRPWSPAQGMPKLDDDEDLFTSEERVCDAYNAGFAALTDLHGLTEKRGNKANVATFLIWYSNTSPTAMEDNTSKTAPRKRPKDKEIYFVWAPTAANADKVLDDVFEPKTKRGRPGVVYVSRKETVAKRVNDVLRKD